MISWGVKTFRYATLVSKYIRALKERDEIKDLGIISARFFTSTKHKLTREGHIIVDLLKNYL
jgi:hypothetical protein